MPEVDHTKLGLACPLRHPEVRVLIESASPQMIRADTLKLLDTKTCLNSTISIFKCLCCLLCHQGVIDLGLYLERPLAAI